MNKILGIVAIGILLLSMVIAYADPMIGRYTIWLGCFVAFVAALRGGKLFVWLSIALSVIAIITVENIGADLQHSIWRSVSMIITLFAVVVPWWGLRQYRAFNG